MHRGVLFLDELCEFPVPVLEALRQPVESGQVTIARKGISVTFPADLQLVGEPILVHVVTPTTRSSRAGVLRER